jgi:hypothetical protein
MIDSMEMLKRAILKDKKRKNGWVYLYASGEVTMQWWRNPWMDDGVNSMGEEIKLEQKCRDFGQAPDCLGDVDLKYTMDFTDVDGDKVYWCTNCGLGAWHLQNLIAERFAKEGRPFLDTLEKMVDEALEKQDKKD